MGGGNKDNKTKQMQQDLSAESARRSSEIYGNRRGDVDWGRGELMGLYQGLGADEGGGGGGGGGGISIPEMTWESSTEPFYRNIMQSETGLYTPQQIAAMKSAGSDPITAAYEGLARNLATERAGRGLGYGAATSGIMRDKAYNLGRMGLQSEADIADKVVGSRMSGAGALTPLESEKRAFQISERDKSRAAANAAAGRAAAGKEDLLATKRSMINQILGLEGNQDLAYQEQAMKGLQAQAAAENAAGAGKKQLLGSGLAAGATIAAAAI